MSPLEDHNYLKICSELANALSISLSSARRKVEIAAAKKGVKDTQTKKDIAAELLEYAKSQKENDDNSAKQLDTLLEALATEENFMTED